MGLAALEGFEASYYPRISEGIAGARFCSANGILYTIIFFPEYSKNRSLPRNKCGEQVGDYLIRIIRIRMAVVIAVEAFKRVFFSLTLMSSMARGSLRQIR